VLAIEDSGLQWCVMFGRKKQMKEKKKQKMEVCHVAKGGGSCWKSKVRNSRPYSTGFAMMAEAQRASPSQFTFTSK
jgi:hypothetical protein